MKEEFLYHYKAHVTKVYDGDTITVNLDCGMNVILKNQKIRLYGINTPELRGSDEEKEKGRDARDFLREKILNKTITLRTILDKTGKYGRLLGVVYVDDIDINELLLTEGHAVEYMK